MAKNGDVDATRLLGAADSRQVPLVLVVQLFEICSHGDFDAWPPSTRERGAKDQRESTTESDGPSIQDRSGRVVKPWLWLALATSKKANWAARRVCRMAHS